MTDVAEGLRQPLQPWLVRQARAMLALAAGGLDEAGKLIHGALAIGEQVNPVMAIPVIARPVRSGSFRERGGTRRVGRRSSGMTSKGSTCRVLGPAIWSAGCCWPALSQAIGSLAAARG
jgi:hypothetical protein